MDRLDMLSHEKAVHLEELTSEMRGQHDCISSSCQNTEAIYLKPYKDTTQVK